MKNKTGLGFLLGAAVGAGLVWFFSSKEGKQLLGVIKDKINELADELMEEPEMSADQTTQEHE